MEIQHGHEGRRTQEYSNRSSSVGDNNKEDEGVLDDFERTVALLDEVSLSSTDPELEINSSKKNSTMNRNRAQIGQLEFDKVKRHALAERRSSSPRFRLPPRQELSSEDTDGGEPPLDEFEEFRQRAMSLPHKTLQVSKSNSFRKRQKNKSPRMDEVYVKELTNTSGADEATMKSSRLTPPKDPQKKLPLRGSPEYREYENNRRRSSNTSKSGYLEGTYRNRAATLPYLPDTTKIHHWRYNPDAQDDDDDVNGSPKSPSLAEQRFRQLPESSEYEKIRTFAVNDKGDIVPSGKGYCYRPKTDTSPSGRSSPGSVPGSPVSITAEGAEILSETGVKRYVVLIIGAENVGKSSLITQLQTCDSIDNDRYDENSESKNILPVLVAGKEVDLFFVEWDTYEKKPWKLRIFCAAVIVMYSVIDKNTFSTAADVLYQLRETYYDVPIIVVANKVDLARQRCVETHDGKELAKSYNCKFVEVSVLLGHETDELLKQLLIDLRKVDKLTGAIFSSGKFNLGKLDWKRKKQKPIIAIKQRANSMYHNDKEAESLRQRLAKSCEDLFAKLWK